MNRDYNIRKMLLSLKFKVSSIGFNYWVTAIRIYRNNYLRYNNSMKSIYIDVAKLHNTTDIKVERAMRTARTSADEEIQKQFNYYNKLNNTAVLELLTNNYEIQLNYNHIPFIN